MIESISPDFGRRVPVVSGMGRVGKIADDVTRLAGKRAHVLLVADAGLKPLGLIDRLRDALYAGNHHVAIYDSIAGEPKEAQVETAIALGSKESADSVVAL